MGDNDHASTGNEQLREARENDTVPDSRADYSMLRLIVDGEKLHTNNPIDKLVRLLLEGKRYDGNWDGNEEQIAKWAVAQWCLKHGWVPDLRDYNVRDRIVRGDDLDCYDAAFYGEPDDDPGGLAALLDDVEETIVDEDMTGASRGQVARGTIGRVRRRLTEEANDV